MLARPPPIPLRPPAAEPDPWPLAGRPGFLIRRAHQIHTALFARHCAPSGLTPVQYSVLTALADGPLDLTALAARVALDRTTTTGAVGRLEARGLVSRSVPAADRRQRLCGITEVGRQALAAVDPAARAAHDATLACLSADEREALARLLARVVEANAGLTGDPG